MKCNATKPCHVAAGVSSEAESAAQRMQQARETAQQSFQLQVLWDVRHAFRFWSFMVLFHSGDGDLWFLISFNCFQYIMLCSGILGSTLLCDI